MSISRMWRLRTGSKGIPLFTPAAPEHVLVDRARLATLLDEAVRGAEAEGGSVAVLVALVSIAGVPDLDFDAAREDRLLRHAIENATRIARRSDSVVAIARNEVCLVLPGISGVEQAELAAMKLIGAINTPFETTIYGRAQRVEPRTAVGIVCPPIHCLHAGELIRGARLGARAACARSPAYHVFDATSLAASADTAALSAPLARALANNDLHLQYQPQIDLANGEVAGVEALSRWTRSPPVTPAVFMPIVEQTGSIDMFTTWLLNSSLRELSGLLAAGIEMSMSINVSPINLEEPEFPEVVLQSIRMWSVPAQRVTLEITESTPMRDAARAVEMLHRLKATGVRIAIDDFGTGYSSLALLRQMPVDELKIDQQFVCNMLGSSANMQIVRSVLDLAHNFGLKTVAEGVEDAATLEALARLGCTLAQGYHIARPLASDALIEWLLVGATVPTDSPG